MVRSIEARPTGDADMIERLIIERIALVAAVIFTFAIALGSLYALIPARDPAPVTLPPTEVAGGTWKTW